MPAYGSSMKDDRAICDELVAAAELLGADGEEFRAMRSSRIYEALEDLGADRMLLAVVGSCGYTLSDDQVLEYLKEWNRDGGRLRFDRIIASTSAR